MNDVGKTIKNEAKKTKNVVRYISLTSKEVKAKTKTSEGTMKAFGFLMLPHDLADFKIQKYYRNELKFNGVYSKNNLPKIWGTSNKS